MKESKRQTKFHFDEKIKEGEENIKKKISKIFSILTVTSEYYAYYDTLFQMSSNGKSSETL